MTTQIRKEMESDNISIFLALIEGNTRIEPTLKEQLEKAALEVQRNKLYKNILLNKDETQISYLVLIYGMTGGIILGLIMSGIVILIPTHDILKHQDYWYELLLQGIFGYVPLNAGIVIINASYWMNTGYIRTTGTWVSLSCTASVIFIFLIMAVYCICRVIGYKYPVPFQGVLFAVVLQVVLYVHLYFQFPENTRKNTTFKKRIKYLYSSLIFSSLLQTQYHLLTLAFRNISVKFQWILGIFLPVVRHGNTQYLLRNSFKSSGTKLWPTECSVSHWINLKNALFIAITVGTYATEETSYVLLGIDFLINLYCCFKIIYFYKKYVTEKCEKACATAIETIRELVLNEHIELVMGVAYFLCVLIAYYGPNSEQIGNVKFGGWHFQAISDIDTFISNLCLLFFIDTCSAVICSVLLWVICKINIFKAYYLMLQEFWLMMAVQTSFSLQTVSIFSQGSRWLLSCPHKYL